MIGKHSDLFDNVPLRRNTRSIKWDVRPPGTPEHAIPLWVADMDFRAPGEVLEALAGRVEHGVFGYSCSDSETDQAVMTWLSERFSWEVERDWLMIFPGVVSALYMTVSALTDPGEGVIVMPPVYYPFYEAIEKTGRRVVSNPLIEVNGAYCIDWAGLESILDSKRASLLIFCSPHNPVGRVWTEQELAGLAELMKNFPDLLVHSDEVHSDLIMPGHVHTPLAQCLDESAQRRLITSRSVSKTFNLAGLKTATLIVSDPDIRSRLQRQLYLTGAGLPNPLGLTALVAAYRFGQPWLEKLIVYLHENYRFVCDVLAEQMPSWQPAALEGSYLAWIRIAGLNGPVADFVERLRREAGVWLEAGSTYGQEGEGYVRLNLGTSRAILGEAFKRIYTYRNDLF